MGVANNISILSQRPTAKRRRTLGPAIFSVSGVLAKGFLSGALCFGIFSFSYINRLMSHCIKNVKKFMR